MYFWNKKFWQQKACSFTPINIQQAGEDYYNFDRPKDHSIHLIKFDGLLNSARQFFYREGDKATTGSYYQK